MNCYKKIFLWSDDTGDANQATVDESKDVYDEVASSFPAPHIILSHSVFNSTVNDVLPYGVTALKERGFQLVSVNACMGEQAESPYEWVGEPQSGNWQC
ncbi:hypothetical protein QFC22_006117 [Naganishia vaughanmartiniae]|uniref:Uncharacterized protein n=1 Tax=Naganishia vaughanmartiniae TaxID=1424756 RepID=A0ACC2WQD0_9TREE|nr:hypothetical protein QFC22_006117 [Naganishia vaughanmartiniae]